MDAEEEDEEKSRSQLKREFQELKELGKELVELSPRQLKGIPVSDATREAIVAAQQMSRSALQRQHRYLAGLIEREDVAAIRSAMSGSPAPAAAEVTAPDREERWCDELIAGDDQFLYEFVEEHPEFDRQRLRQLTRNARDEPDLEEPSKSAQKLLDYLKSRG